MSAGQTHAGVPSSPTSESGPGRPGGRRGRRSWRVVAAGVETVLAVVPGGGFLAVGASIYDSLSRVEPGCEGVVANHVPKDSSYADIDAAIRSELTREGHPTWLAPGGVPMARILGGVDLTSLSPIEAVARLDGRPILIAHGTQDQRMSVRHAYDPAGELATHGGLAEMWIVPGSKHTMAIREHPVEHERRLADFFRRTLGVP